LMAWDWREGDQKASGSIASIRRMKAREIFGISGVGRV
jgi:hypothetical protein